MDLPPLRSRREDIVPLFLGFLAEAARGSAPAVEPTLVEALYLYDWPLNVRELRSLAELLPRVHAGKPKLKRSHLPFSFHPNPSERPQDPGKRPRRPTDDKSEFEALVAALKDHHGVVSRACAALGMERSRANRLLKAHGDFSLDALREGR